jgi:hypothetical protein
MASLSSQRMQRPPKRPADGAVRGRGDRLRDHGGREWTVQGAAYLDPEGGEYRAVLVSGAQVLIEREGFCDSYVVLSG